VGTGRRAAPHVLFYYTMSYYRPSLVSGRDPATWRSRVAVRARPAQVLEVLTDPDACARWSPVGFDVHGLDGDRLRGGSSATVTGALHGWPMRFAIEVIDVRGDRFRLRAVGPVEMLVDYAVRPVGRGSTVDAAISVTPRTGPGSALTARLTGLLLRGGALHHALRRMGKEAAIGAHRRRRPAPVEPREREHAEMTLQLCELEVPGLRVATSLGCARTALRRRFPGVTDVLATTRPGTLLLVYEGDEELEQWAATLEAVRRSRPAPAAPAAHRRMGEPA
jgi:hypothetical protein